MPARKSLGLVIFLAAIFSSFTLQASPPGSLPWISSTFEVATASGKVTFQLKGEDGKLSQLKATRGKQSAVLPIDQLSVFKDLGPFSGASTEMIVESEETGEEYAIGLKLNLSEGYTREQLYLTLELKSFQFVEMEHSREYAGESPSLERVDLRKK